MYNSPTVRLALLGQACGDAFGAPFEYNPQAAIHAIRSMHEGRYLDAVEDCGAKATRGRLPGLYTDDTQQALLLLHARENKTYGSMLWFQEQATAMSQPLEGAPFGVHRGTGRNFREAIQTQHPVDTAGLGAAMRVGPVAVSFENPQEMIDWVLAVSSVTTSNPIALASAAKFAAVCWVVANPSRRSEIASLNWPTGGPWHIPPEVWTATTAALRAVKEGGEEGLLTYARSLGWSNKEMDCAANGFALTGFAWAVDRALTSGSYSEALVNVCASGGDTDTVGAMTGCLAALKHRYERGIPEWMVDKLVGRANIEHPENWDPRASEEVLTLAECEHWAIQVTAHLKAVIQRTSSAATQNDLDLIAMAHETFEAEAKTKDAQGEPVLFGATKGGTYGSFSNFAPAPFTLNGETWPTSEHYFMAQKNPDDADYQRAIRAATTPGKAKALGRRVELRADWDRIKYGVMFEGVLAKFEQNPPLRVLLLATGGRPIHEDRPDPWWGGGPNYPKGRDWLGKILVEVREALRKSNG